MHRAVGVHRPPQEDFHFLKFVCCPAELPRLEVDVAMEPVHYSAPPSVSHNGFLFKTASMARAVTERKAREGNGNIQVKKTVLRMHILPFYKTQTLLFCGASM